MISVQAGRPIAHGQVIARATSASKVFDAGSAIHGGRGGRGPRRRSRVGTPGVGRGSPVGLMHCCRVRATQKIDAPTASGVSHSKLLTAHFFRSKQSQPVKRAAFMELSQRLFVNGRLASKGGQARLRHWSDLRFGPGVRSRPRRSDGR